MSELCPACGEIKNEQRSAWAELIPFHLGLEHDASMPVGLTVFCQLCIWEIASQRDGRKLLFPDTDQERFEPITEAHIDLFLARRLSEIANRLARGLPVVRCQAVGTQRDVRCARYAAKRLDGLWVCGMHGHRGFTPYRYGLQLRHASFFAVNAEPEIAVRQLTACMAPDDIEKLIELLKDNRPKLIENAVGGDPK